MSKSEDLELLTALQPLIPALRRYAAAMVRNRELADDLVQDCLERAISNWKTRRQAANTRQWVFAIAHNLIMSRLRQDARRGEHIDIADVDEAAVAAPAPQESRLRHEEVLRAIAALPDDQRAVITLVSVEDLSYAEAAQTLDIPIGTVMSRLARARERLARALEGGLGRREPAAAPPPLRRLK